MSNRCRRVLIGLCKDVEISQIISCFGRRYSLPPKHYVIGMQTLVPIQADTNNITPPTKRSIADDEALDQLAPDSFDMVVIYAPSSEKASGTFKQLIRIARQGLILLGTTRS